MKGTEAERLWRANMLEKFKAYLDAMDGKLFDKFDWGSISETN